MHKFNFLLLIDASQGLQHEIAVFEVMLEKYKLSRRCEIEVIKMKMEDLTFNPKYRPIQFDEVSASVVINIVVFWERLVDCLLIYDSSLLKVFIPHPEINVPGTLKLLKYVDHIWHKTKLSIDAFKNHAHQAAHLFTGWTSIDPNISVSNYRNFAHFRGKASNRHSTQILNVWRQNTHYPELRYHFYQELSNSWEEPFEFKEWLKCRNISIMSGKIDKNFYFNQLSECGIHLCLSGVEGFGHYINESRAMSAVVVVLNAPPMNELTDSNSGILIDPTGCREMGLVSCHTVGENEIKFSIDEILSLPETRLRELGRTARECYLSQAQLFYERSSYLLDLIRQDHN